MNWRKAVVIAAVFLMAIISGCSGIREIETNSNLREKGQFITEQEAISTVQRMIEDKSVGHVTSNPYLYVTEQFPTADRPVFIIRAAQDDGDHLHTLTVFKINAIDSSVISTSN